MSITLKGLYYVYSDQRPFNPIAIEPRLQNSRAEWEDTAKGVVIAVKKYSFDFEKKDLRLKEDGSGFNITTVDGISITLEKLTLELFREKVKDQVVGNPDFATLEELTHYYLSKNFERH